MKKGPFKDLIHMPEMRKPTSAGIGIFQKLGLKQGCIPKTIILSALEVV